MTRLWVPEEPRGLPDHESASIRVAATAVGFSHPLMDRINWLLAARQGIIAEYEWDGKLTTLTEGRVYHNPSPNCKRIAVLAIIERATSTSGNIKITPSDGAGTFIDYDHVLTAATTRWGAPGWSAFAAALDLVDQAEQYHAVEWTDLRVRSLVVLEIPLDYLDSTTDTMVEDRGAGRSGLDAGRWITDSAVAGIPALLVGIEEARDATLRHLGGMITEDAEAWSATSDSAWGPAADGSLYTADFAWKHRARHIRAAVSDREYQVRIRARYTGTGTGSARLRSSESGVSATFSSLTGSFAWYTPDGGGTLTVQADTDDELIPEVYTSNASTAVEISQISIYEARP